jgi:hypothetical protein
LTTSFNISDDIKIASKELVLLDLAGMGFSALDILNEVVKFYGTDSQKVT